MKEEQISTNRDSLPHGNIELHQSWKTPETHEETYKLYNANKTIIFAAYKLYGYLDHLKKSK